MSQLQAFHYMFHPICTGRGGAFGPQLRSSTPRQAGGHWTVMGMEAEKSMGYLLANGKSPFLMGKPSENHGKMVIYIYIFFIYLYGKSPFSMGKCTISTGPFSIANC